MTDRTHPDSGRIITSSDILLHDAETAPLYEELRAAIDDGHESMTHADALAEVAAMRAENIKLRAKLAAVGAGGVQALSAAPEAIAKLRHLYQNMVNGAVRDTASAKRIAEGLLAPAIEALERATPPAEQQAPKETLGGVNGWRDISTAPKDGSRFVAIGYNYGLYSEGRHICVAQWFRGCWMEASDWNETSELKYLTHWMPLPSPPDDVAAPAEQQAAPKAALGKQFDSEGFRAWVLQNLPDETIIGRSAWWADHLTTWAQRFAKAAPQQEAQDSVSPRHPVVMQWRDNAIEVEVRKQDAALIRQLVEALEGSIPIAMGKAEQRNTALIAARARLGEKT